MPSQDIHTQFGHGGPHQVVDFEEVTVTILFNIITYSVRLLFVFPPFNSSVLFFYICTPYIRNPYPSRRIF